MARTGRGWGWRVIDAWGMGRLGTADWKLGMVVALVVVVEGMACVLVMVGMVVVVCR